MAEQGADGITQQEPSEAGATVKENDPFAEPNNGPTEIVPTAATTEPRPVPTTAAREPEFPAERDPFDEPAPSTPAARVSALPREIPDAEPTAAPARPVVHTPAAAPADSSGFDPFDSSPQATPKVTTNSPQPAAATQPATSDPFELDPAEERSARTVVKPATSVPAAATRNLPTDLDFGSTTIESRPAESKVDDFEKPVPVSRSASSEPRPTNNDPFNSADLAPQKPAVPIPVAEPVRQTPTINARAVAQDDFPAFPDAKASVPEVKKPAAQPAEFEPSIDQPFEQNRVPAKSAVPSLSIPSRDQLPVDRTARNDDRFGGFRAATAQDSTANAFNGSDRPIPTVSDLSIPRAARPAPVSQIDEDFGAKPTGRPLIAGDSYAIEPNDNFWTISRKKYGSGRYFMALAQHNVQVISDPRRMKPGVTIATPAADVLERTYPQLIPKAAAVDPVQTASLSTTEVTKASAPAPAQPVEADAGFFTTDDGNPMYRVGSEDTLSGIAQRHLGRSSRWVQVFEMNRDVLTDGNSLKIGTVLRLPADASRVDVVGGERIYR
jgi:nucleoid-associated protein YgaU